MYLNSPLKCATLGFALLLCAAGANAQMFKWTDAKGVVHYSDQPPPAGEDIKVETKSFSGGRSDVALPYELALAARNHPVTLFTTSDCNACDQGRAMLKQRGIPFVEKTVTTSADQQKFKEAGGAGQLPLLVVGGVRRVGFEAEAWNETLSNASYPSQRMLPANYQYPAAAPAAPKPPPAREGASEQAAAPGPMTPPAETPTGFRF
jgi:glutaredoxin